MFCSAKVRIIGLTAKVPTSLGLAKAFYATTDRRAALATQYSFIESRIEQLFFGTLFAHTKV